MFDLFDLLDAPKSLLLGFLRVLWWFVWDFWVETVGWTIGWCVCRTLTFGHFPRERLGDQDQASFATCVCVVLMGLGVLATTIWGLSGVWPM